MFWVRIMDSTYGIGLQGLDFFVIMYVHPETQVALPLAFFLRKRGTEEDPHPLLPDLVWMEQVLQQHFDFPPPRYVIVDRCAASLGAHAEIVKSDWASQRDVGYAIAPQHPPAQLLRDPTAVFSAALNELRSIAHGCTGIEETAFTEYLCWVSRSNWDSSAPSSACVVPPAAVGSAGRVFGHWATTHPSLVRGLAKHLLHLLVKSRDNVAASDASAGAVHAALAELQSFEWAIADTDSPTSSCFRVLVERWMQLCFFHAKKAIREHGEHMEQVGVQWSRAPHASAFP